MSYETITVKPIAGALGARPEVSYVAPFGYVAVFDSDAAVAGLMPDMQRTAALDRSALIVTAPGTHSDIVIRVFAPAVGLPEDPVCGTAHRIIAPYWAKRLGKSAFKAFQASRRGGEVGCRLHGDRVELEGACVFYLEGTADV